MPHPWLLQSIVVPAGLVALPLGYVVVRSWQAGPAGVFAELLRPRTVELLGNTLTLTLSVTLCAAMIGTAAAWCTERCDLPGRGFWRIAASLPLALPAYVSSYAWSSLGPWLQGMAGAIVILTFYSVPLIYLPVAAALRGMDPNFEDVARSLGHGRWISFFRVVLPQAGPALGGGALLVASHMLAEFGALAFLQVETFTTAIFQQYQLQFDNAAAALLSGVLMALCLPVVLAEMRLRRGRRLARISRGSARAPVPIPLGRWTPLVLLGFAGLTLLAFGVPFVTLGFWLWRGTSAGLGIATLLPALIGSLSFSLPGAALTAVLALPLVLASTRGRGRIAGFADRLPYLVHGLPGIVVALAVVSVSIRYVPALYQSLAVVFAAYAILCLPLAQSAIRVSAELVPPELDDVARSLGKGPFRAFVLATLPGLLPGIRAALALSALVLMRELTATLLLAPAGMVTLATEFWSYTSDRAYAAAAPFAAVLVLVSGLPLFVFTLKSSLAPSEGAMSAVRIAGLGKRYGGRVVLHGIDLAVPSGAIVALLGPSGCGKTTLLRLIAGFDSADAGEIAIDERIVEAAGVHVPPERRHVGYVPQEGTLFPHLTVAGNVGFGLDRAARRGGKIAEVLRLTGLAGLERRHPNQLSGGQQQRTALARALAPQPGIILLDEPFNALDADLRRSVCEEVVATLRASGTTAILVTHDPQEAFASADLVAVMHDGAIAQYGDPTSLYRMPNHAQVARLTGPTVFLSGRIKGRTAHTVLGPVALRETPCGVGPRATIFLRPEQIVLAPPGAGVSARIEKRLFRGDHFLATVRVGDIALQVRLTEKSVPAATDTIGLVVAGEGLAFAERPEA